MAKILGLLPFVKFIFMVGPRRNYSLGRKLLGPNLSRRHPFRDSQSNNLDQTKAGLVGPCNGYDPELLLLSSEVDVGEGIEEESIFPLYLKLKASTFASDINQLSL